MRMLGLVKEAFKKSDEKLALIEYDDYKETASCVRCNGARHLKSLVRVHKLRLAIAD